MTRKRAMKAKDDKKTVRSALTDLDGTPSQEPEQNDGAVTPTTIISKFSSYEACRWDA